ncbi:MAG: Multidrug resistance protein [Planctomycetaceae bacterium]|nr:Multidrug resistance protein [Planctomycetaceae bacterium]
MTTPVPPAPPAAPTTAQPAATPVQPVTAASPPVPKKLPFLRFLQVGGLMGLAVVTGFFVYTWWSFRLSHSITEDAFVEAHIVNVAPQSVSGHLVRFLVEENDRVEQGQVLAEVDPVTYHDQVQVARSKVDGAEAELRRQEAALANFRLEVPIQIDIARRGMAAAMADEARAQAALKLTEDEVEHGIEEAQAGLDAATADLVLAQQEYTRFTILQKEDAVPLRRAQEVTRARDAAEAHRKLSATKLARAQADKTRIEVAKRTLEASETATQKAKKGVDLADIGNTKIHEVELLTAVKKEGVTEARTALASTEDQLKYTQIRAPFPGVVVKRYRHLGDFASAGVPILSMYNPDLLYVTANLEETRLRGVAPGNPVELHVDAFEKSFRGRVAWIDKSTGAQFALMPRNVVAGEFTKVVQRVPVRIAIDKDDRWPLLRAGLSVQAVIKHGTGDPALAEQAARGMVEIETRFNRAKD